MTPKGLTRTAESGYPRVDAEALQAPGAALPRSLVSITELLRDAGLGILSAGAVVGTAFAPEIMAAGPDEALAAADAAALGLSAAATDPAALAAADMTEAGVSGAAIEAVGSATAADSAVTLNAASQLPSGAAVPEWFSSASAWTDRNVAEAVKGLQKHGDRISSWFPKIANNRDLRAPQVREIVSTILNDSTAVSETRQSATYGDYVDIFANGGDGVGVRYGRDRGFIGLLEPGFMRDAGRTATSGFFD